MGSRMETNMKRVLVACEESQRVCIAFRERGFEAYSCDILPCSGGHPEWHIQCDVYKLLYVKSYPNYMFMTQNGEWHDYEWCWDLIIAHPPCTYLSNAGARFLYPKGILNEERLKHGQEAAEFFMLLYNAQCKYIAVENPIPSKIYGLPPYTQIIQPYMFGVPLQKKTCLWLKNLPRLEPTNLLNKVECQSTKVPGNWFNKGGLERQKNRSKTFKEIAEAMADQWGKVIEDAD